MLIMFLTTFDVIGRALFNHSITGAYELTELGSAIVIFFTLAVTHKYKEHVAVGFLVDKLSAKKKAMIEGLVDLFIFVLILIMSFQLINEAMRLMERGTTTTDLGLPIYTFILIVSIGSFIFAFVALANGIKSMIEAVKKS